MAAGNQDWFSVPVVFHNNHGGNIILSQNNTVATKVDNNAYNIVCTSEPMLDAQMFKVTVLKRDEGRIGGLAIGLTVENPETSKLPQSWEISHYKNDEHLLYIDGRTINYKGKRLCNLDFDTWNLEVGQSLGILLTRERDLHWFLDNKWRGMVHVDGYPLDRPLWGVAEVFGKCKQLKAVICSVSGYDIPFGGQLVEAGVITSPHETRSTPLRQPQPPGGSDKKQPVNEDLLHQLLQEQESLRQQVQRLQEDLTQERQTVSSLRTEKSQLQQQNNHLQQQVTQSNSEISQLQQQIAMLARNNNLLQQQVTQSGGEIDRLRQQVLGLRRMLSATSRNIPNSQEIEFWQVSPDEVSIRDDQVLGRGAWGYVAKGTFRGKTVAVKRVWPEILEQTTLDRIRREIRTMAQVRHPNLVLFIAAVLNEQTGPMIVTELLDTSLRQAYQRDRVGPNKRKIFVDVSSALVYLHEQREPIIHRDVSSANVLLISSHNNTWLAKLSDFGSANLARYATTPGEGAILYTAPEAFPHPPTSPTPPPPQTTKIDVYSFGVVACEVITRVFPESHKLIELMEAVRRSWPQIHQLINSCISHSPQDRPTMATVLRWLQQLESEP